MESGKLFSLLEEFTHADEILHCTNIKISVICKYWEIKFILLAINFSQQFLVNSELLVFVPLNFITEIFIM